jgi:hypothetical protein
VQSRSITRRFRAAVGAAVLTGAIAGVISDGVSLGQDTPVLVAPETPPDSGARWQEAPDYVALFVARPYREAYRAFVSPLPLDEVLHAIAPDEHRLQAPGSWTAGQQGPLDVFGTGGTYDRWKLARLFGSRSPQVARGPLVRDGLVAESWTLVSPYPAADLSRLQRGTLLIILRVP